VRDPPRRRAERATNLHRAKVTSHKVCRFEEKKFCTRHTLGSNPDDDFARTRLSTLYRTVPRTHDPDPRPGSPTFRSLSVHNPLRLDAPARRVERTALSHRHGSRLAASHLARDARRACMASYAQPRRASVPLGHRPSRRHRPEHDRRSATVERLLVPHERVELPRRGEWREARQERAEWRYQRNGSEKSR